MSKHHHPYYRETVNILQNGGAVAVSREVQRQLERDYPNRVREINEYGFRNAPSTVVEFISQAEYDAQAERQWMRRAEDGLLG